MLFLCSNKPLQKLGYLHYILQLGWDTIPHSGS